jgi:uncharacterized protein DUF885
MIKKIVYPLVILVFVTFAPTVNGEEQPAGFEGFKQYYIETFWSLNPGYAIYSGYHKYDDVLQIPNNDTRDRKLKALKGLTDSLSHYDVATMSANLKTDYWMIKDQINSDIWYLTKFKSFEWNPAAYNIAGGFAQIINGTYAPLNERLIAVSKRLEYVTPYYEAAKKNIKSPTREHTELAVLQNKGSLSVFGESLTDSINISSLSKKEKQLLFVRIELAKSSINSYISFLEKLIKTTGNEQWRSFRIGKELYESKFQHDIASRYTAIEIFNKASLRKDELHVKMAEIARGLWKKYLDDAPMPDNDAMVIQMVIDKISLNHVHRDSFMVAIQKQIPELEKFVTDKNLIYLDPKKPLVVRKTPEYMEGSGAGASISSPGPYDKFGNTYYNVSPLSGYTDEQAESYLREYNHYILQILNIHEAIPGHYTQLVYANNSPSLIKSIFGNGAMIEGWAVYSELMMLENGYGNHKPEMWLMYYKWHLRSVCNTILDYSVHVLGMKENEAISFLTKEAFQETAEATGKWRRVKLSQVQLTSYYTGFYEIYTLREKVLQQLHDDFELREFHEKFLSYGSAPVKYIHRLMTND